jgi:hypothetical protein
VPHRIRRRHLLQTGETGSTWTTKALIPEVRRAVRLKYNHLLTNAVAIRNVIDLPRAVRALMVERYAVKHEDLAPLRLATSSASGSYVFTVTAPEPFDGELLTPFPMQGSPARQS